MLYPIESTVYTFNVTGQIYRKITQRFGWIGRLGVFLFWGVCVWIGISVSIITGCIWAVFIWLSLIDIYEGIIPDSLNLLLLTLLWCQYPFQEIRFAIICIGLLLSVKLILEKIRKISLIGWGDIKLIFICLCFIPVSQVPVFFLICGLSTLIPLQISSVQMLPLGPFISLSFLYVVSTP